MGEEKVSGANAIALYSLQNATARESPSHRDISPPRQLPKGSASVGQSSPLTPPASESSVEALRCAFKSLEELNNYWLLASASSYAVQLLCKHIRRVYLCQALVCLETLPWVPSIKRKCSSESTPAVQTFQLAFQRWVKDHQTR